MNRNTQLSMILAALLVPAIFSDAMAEKPAYVSAELTYPGGRTQTCDLIDEPLVFVTGLGEMEFRLSQIRQVSLDARRQKWVLETVQDDCWVGKLLTGRLSYLYLGALRQFSPADLQFSKLEIRKGAAEPLKPFIRPKLFLSDGSAVYLHPADLSMKVDRSAGAWDLPVGALKALKFSVDGARGEVYASARFPGGQNVSFLAGRTKPVKGRGMFSWMTKNESFHGTDMFGNSLDIPFSLVNGFLGRVGVEDAAAQAKNEQIEGAAASGVNLSALTAAITSADGRTDSVRINIASWSVRGLAGDILLPLPLIQEVTFSPKSSLANVHTVYGDRLIGRLSPSTIQVPMAKDEIIDIRLDRQSRVCFPVQALTPPKDFWQWSLSDRQSLYAQPEDAEWVLSPEAPGGKPLRVPVRLVTSILRQKTKFTFTLSDGRTCVGTPEESSVSTLLLVNGMRLQIPWKNVRFMGKGVAIPPESELEDTKDAQKSKVEPRKGTSKPTPEKPSEKAVEEDPAATSEAVEPTIKPGVTLSVAVFAAGNKEINEPEKRVSAGGTITLPLVGTVKVKDMTLDQVSAHLTQLYKDYIRDPSVDVSFVFDESSGKVFPWGYVTVLGRVQKPGAIAIPPTQELTLSMAIQLAGGLDTSAKETGIRITRQDPKTNKKEIFDVDLREIGSQGEANQDIPLKSGDVVYVPERIL